MMNVRSWSGARQLSALVGLSRHPRATPHDMANDREGPSIPRNDVLVVVIVVIVYRVVDNYGPRTPGGGRRR